MLETKVLGNDLQKGEESCKGVQYHFREAKRGKSLRESDNGGEGEGQACQTTTAVCALGTKDSVSTKYARWKATKPSKSTPW